MLRFAMSRSGRDATKQAACSGMCKMHSCILHRRVTPWITAARYAVLPNLMRAFSKCVICTVTRRRHHRHRALLDFRKSNVATFIHAARCRIPLRPHAHLSGHPMRLLLLEDDVTLGATLSDFLRSDHVVDWCRRLGDVAALQQEPYDMLIVDWQLPDGTAVDWVRSLRRAGNATP